MKSLINQISKSVRFLGLMGMMAAFAGALAFAPAADARRLDHKIDYGKLNVAAVDANSGVAVSGATVEVLNASGDRVAKELTNAYGQFSMYISVGTYTVRVTATGYEQFSDVVKVAAAKSTNVQAALKSTSPPVPTTDEGVGGPVPVPAITTGKLNVKVYDVSGVNDADVPLAGAKVSIFDKGGAVVAQGETPATGTFTVELPTGTYTVVASAEGYPEPASQVVSIGADEETTIALSLKR